MPALSEARRKLFWQLGILVALTWIVYIPSFSVPFQLDDFELLLGNPLIRNPSLILQQPFSRKFITFLSFSLNYTLHGTRTFGFHLVNFALHAMTGVLFYCSLSLILRARVTVREEGERLYHLLPLFAALVFLAHPLQTESITYIWQRAEAVSGFLCMAAYFTYLLARLKRKKFYYVLAIFIFGLGLLEKGTIVALPLLILGTEIILFESSFGRIGGRWALIILWAVFLMVLFPYKPWQTLMKSIHSFEMTVLGLQFSETYLMTQTWVALQYLKLSFWPFGLNVEPDVILAKSFFEPRILFASAGLFSIVLFAIWSVKRNRWITFGIFWFFVCLLPTSFIYREPMWDHRTYLSVAGFGIFLAAGISTLIRWPLGRYLLSAVLVLFLAVLTLQRNFVWQSPIAILEDAVKKSPLKARPHQQLGALYLRDGRLKDAERMLRRTILLSPTYAESYNNLGIILVRQGFRQEAIDLFLKAASLRSHFVIPYLNLGDLFLYTPSPDYPQAIFYYEKALDIEPRNLVATLHLAHVYRLQGDYDKALTLYDRAIQTDPRLAEAYFRKGEIYSVLKKYESAKDMLEAAQKFAPDNPNIDLYLSKIYAAMGDLPRAAGYSREAQKKKSAWQENRQKNLGVNPL